MQIDLKGRVALVTGSSRGIGFGVARVLANCGADLILISRSAERLKEAQRRIEKDSGIRPSIVPADLSQDEGRAKGIREVKEFGEVDILFFSIGGPPPGRFEELKMVDWRRATELLLYPPVYLTRELLPDMKKKGWGRLIYLTSVAIKEPLKGLTLSNVVRVSTAGLVRDLARELTGYGITVNGIMPGMINTERLRELAKKQAAERGIGEKEVLEEFAGEIPAGRLGEPEEIGYLAAFLASDKASYISGAMIPVDGGRLRSVF